LAGGREVSELYRVQTLSYQDPSYPGSLPGEIAYFYVNFLETPNGNSVDLLNKKIGYFYEAIPGSIAQRVDIGNAGLPAQPPPLSIDMRGDVEPVWRAAIDSWSFASWVAARKFAVATPLVKFGDLSGPTLGETRCLVRP
jgi:hypothetical protein